MTGSKIIDECLERACVPVTVDGRSRAASYPVIIELGCDSGASGVKRVRVVYVWANAGVIAANGIEHSQK